MKETKHYKVAVLYIATGRYTVFWDHFYRSAERYLLNDCQKHYFLFTDHQYALLGEESDCVSRIYQSKLGWPYDTLMRFDMFLSIKEQLKNYDFVFFFNANTEIIKHISEEMLLPINENKNLVFAYQPHMFHLPKSKFTYDRNPKSTAYISIKEGKYYVTGALNGGRTENYLAMCEILSRNIHHDLDNNIIALWHDESHLNHYILNRNDIKLLPPYFTKGEAEWWKKSSRIMFSDKTHYRFGGHAYLRGESDQKISQNEWIKNHARTKSNYKLRFRQYFKSLFL